MIVIPAIDLKAGRVVRLEQGDLEKDTIYNTDPAEVAAGWEAVGAELIHIVDLDGAVSGMPVNQEAVLSIRSRVKARLELGGGIRDIETAKYYIDRGVDRIILGTVARKNPELVIEACKRFPGKIVVGVDARAGRVAVEGWTEDTEMEAAELAKKFEDAGVSEVIYTDIERDGMLTGLAFDSLREFSERVNLPVIAAGGVSGIEDIKKILPLEKTGVKGVITGRAIYEGRLDLREAIELCRSWSEGGDSEES